MPNRSRLWSDVRIARLAFLLGRGLPAAGIAVDRGVAASPAAVRQQAHRLGLAFRAADGPRLPAAVLGRFAAAADTRGIDLDALIHRLLVNAGSDHDLIANILDDV